MRAKLVMAVVALLPLIAPGPALSADPTPVGLWQAVDDDTKQPTGWFLISDHDGVYDGIIAKMFLKPGEDPECGVRPVQGRPPRSSLARARNHPRHEAGRRPTNSRAARSSIRATAKSIKATMKVTPDGQTLVVRGYLGIELLGQNQYWTRLPDSAYSMLDPSINPKPGGQSPTSGRAKRPPAHA